MAHRSLQGCQRAQKKEWIQGNMKEMLKGLQRRADVSRIKSTHTVELLARRQLCNTDLLWWKLHSSNLAWAHVNTDVNLGSFRASQVLKLLQRQVLLYAHLSCTTLHLQELWNWKLSSFSGSSSTFGAFFLFFVKLKKVKIPPTQGKEIADMRDCDEVKKHSDYFCDCF